VYLQSALDERGSHLQPDATSISLDLCLMRMSVWDPMPPS
jgi:hypothetical protein